MRRASLYILFFCLSIFSAAHSYAEEDPYLPKEGFQSGWNQGKKFETKFNRPLELVKDPEELKRVGAQPGDIVIANYYANRRFWIAKIPPNAVEDVLIIEQKMGPAMHLLTHFKFKEGKGALLFAHDPNAKLQPSKVPVMEMLVHGVGLFPEGGRFSKPKSLLGNMYNLSASAMSLESLKAGNVKWGATLQPYLIDTTDEVKQAMFEKAVGMTETLGYQTQFKSFSANCHTVTLSIVDQTLGGKRVNSAGLTRVPFLLPNLGVPFLPSVQNFLASRGLRAKDAPMLPTLNHQWEVQKLEAESNLGAQTATDLAKCNYGAVKGK